MRRLVIMLILCAAAGWAQTPLAEDIDSLALRIAGQGTPVERARRLVEWTNREFTWSATDYQQRSAEEIIARRGGNCFELSKVLVRLLKPAGIRYRGVAEVNIHPYTPRRQQTAEAKVKEKGNAMSVFGLRHNDHRWLEVEDGQGGWVPADPSIGVVGARQWVAMRMALGERPRPPVAPVAEIVKDMKAPFVVFAPATDGIPREDRSRHYLIDEFNAFYGGRLSELPAWREWVTAVEELSPVAMAAFEGKVNLHESSDKIARLEQIYDALRQQALAQGLKPAN